MTEQNPITPPPELVERWIAEIWHEGTPVQVAASDLFIATQAARWGWEQRGAANESELQKARDEDLRACELYLAQSPYPTWAKDLRAARRPKPPNQAEQALENLDSLQADLKMHGLGTNTDFIRAALKRLRALEQLPDTL